MHLIYISDSLYSEKMEGILQGISIIAARVYFKKVLFASGRPEHNILSLNTQEWLPEFACPQCRSHYLPINSLSLYPDRLSANYDLHITSIREIPHQTLLKPFKDCIHLKFITSYAGEPAYEPVNNRPYQHQYILDNNLCRDTFSRKNRISTRQITTLPHCLSFEKAILSRCTLSYFCKNLHCSSANENHDFIKWLKITTGRLLEAAPDNYN